MRPQHLLVVPGILIVSGCTVKEASRLIEERPLAAGQGVALAEDAYYGAAHTTIFRFDTQWNLIEEKPIQLKGVNHMGAIDHHDGHIWAGFLNHGLTDGEHDPALDRSIIARIRREDLQVIQTWDITEEVTWIDPVCFDGRHLWVGDLSDLGIHRYELVDGKLVRDGVFRYRKAMHFSQGVRIRNNRLYTIHTFGTMNGLFEFEIPRTLTNSINRPTRVWPIQESRMHLEGFDFVLGQPDRIWHAQGEQVDLYELNGLAETTGNKAGQ